MHVEHHTHKVSVSAWGALPGGLVAVWFGGPDKLGQIGEKNSSFNGKGVFGVVLK